MSALVNTATGEAPLCQARTRSRSSRLGRKRPSSEQTTKTLSTLAASTWGLSASPALARTMALRLGKHAPRSSRRAAPPSRPPSAPAAGRDRGRSRPSTGGPQLAGVGQDGHDAAVHPGDPARDGALEAEASNAVLKGGPQPSSARAGVWVGQEQGSFVRSARLSRALVVLADSDGPGLERAVIEGLDGEFRLSSQIDPLSLERHGLRPNP